jgi:hypothetical protein
MVYTPCEDVYLQSGPADGRLEARSRVRHGAIETAADLVATGVA